MSREVVALERVHPDEWPECIISELLRKRGTSAVKSVVGNPASILQAAALHNGPPPRLLEGENITLRGKGSPHGTPADRQAHQLIMLSRQFDFTADIHGTEASTGYVCYSPHASMLVRSVGALLSPKAMLTPDYSIYYYMTNTLVVELSKDDDVVTPEMVTDLLIDIADGFTPPYRPIEEYMYSGALSADTGDAMGMRRYYEQFEPLTPHDNDCLVRLGYPPVNYYATSWDADRYAVRTGYWGEFMVRAQ